MNHINNTQAFDEALTLTPDDSNTVFTAHTAPAYQNMIGPWGGITAAALIKALSQRNDTIGQPLSLSLHYLNALAEGEYTISTEMISSTRTTQHFSVRVEQNGKPMLQALSLWGTLREAPREAKHTQPTLPAPETIEPDDLFMPWSKNYEFRFAKGGIRQTLNPPADQQPDESTESIMWVRNQPPRPIDYELIASIADSFAPRAMLRYRQYVPVGTVSLTVYFHASTQMLTSIGDDYIIAEAQTVNFGEGWFDHHGKIWSRDGLVLATTTQLAYFKPPQENASS